jgi:transcription initiation factor IIE alpha subunit
MPGTTQPSVYDCPECESEDTFEEATSNVFFCNACGYEASIDDVMDPHRDSDDEDD